MYWLNIVYDMKKKHFYKNLINNNAPNWQKLTKKHPLFVKTQKYSDFASFRIGSTPPMNSYFRSKEGLPNPLLPLAAVPKIQHLRLRGLQVLHPSHPWARTPPPMLSTYKQRVRSLLLWGSRDLVILCRILTSETNRLKS